MPPAPEAPANFGFLDQQCATRWVKRNIAAFGGDPENITIGGQSAGGMSICAQMTNLKNEGLFQRAIVQSGTFTQPYGTRMGLFPRTMAEAEAQGVRFFEALGVKTLAEARALPARVVEDMSLTWPWGCWGETVDGVFSAYPSNEWYLHEDRIHCDVLLGQTSSEFTSAPPADSEEALRAFAAEQFGEDAEEFLSFFTHPAAAESIAGEGRMHSIAFAIRTVDPNGQDSQGKNLPLWPELTEESPAWMTFADASSPRRWTLSGLEEFLLAQYLKSRE